MSNFLKHLITRHQMESDGLKSSHIVQPRPKSRFEANFGSGVALGQDIPSLEPIAAIADIPTSRIQNTSVLNQATTVRNPQITEHDTRDKNKLSDTLSLTPKGNSSLQDTAGLTTPDKSHQNHKEHTELGSNAEQSRDPSLSEDDALNTRIQTILQRLNSERDKSSNHRTSIEHKRETELLNSASVSDQSPLPHSEKRQVIPGKYFEPEQADKPIKQGTDTQSRKRVVHQSGVLQTPNWLTDIQSVIASRMQEIKSQEKSEPVINVTIGRVEVKAIQTDSVKQENTHQKSSGVMTLDDYLKQRNRGHS